MELSSSFLIYLQWSGIFTLICLVLTILAFLLKWGVRFRLFGVTSFMVAVTASIFALGLGISTHTVVPGAVRYSLVYDNGANQTVITVPSTITPTETDATLRQAASDLFSYGRGGVAGNNQLTVRARTLIHPKPGLSVPLYLGEVKRSLKVRKDDNIEVTISQENFAKLIESKKKA